MAVPRRVGLAIEFFLLFKHHVNVLAGVKRYADEKGWLLFFDDWICETLAASTRGRPAYDGVIARVDVKQLPLIKVSAARHVPLVNVMGGSPAVDDLPGVLIDDAEVGRLRAEHLMARGLRHFACFSVADRRVCECQASAFTATAVAAGCSVTRLDIPENWEESFARYRHHVARIQDWIDAWELPIGLAAPDDAVARLLGQMILAHGLRIPEDVAIVGGMNEEQVCESTRPTLTSVEMGHERVGFEAARLLDRLMDEADTARSRRTVPLLGRRSRKPAVEPIHVILPPVGLVVRESTDFFAAEDDLVTQAQNYIAAACHTHLEVSDVAEHVCVSVRTLQNRFHAVLSRSVGQEIRRARLEKAKQELVSTDRPIWEIARRAGFTSNRRMSEVFRREEGVSPSAYRKQRKARTA